jgi:hypothetical protein
MKRIMLAGMLAVLAAWGTAAQEGAAPTRMATIQVPVKQYKILLPSDVYRAALSDVQAPVRFRDAFVGQIPVPAAAAQVTVGDAQFFTVLAFRMQSGLLCLVPSSNAEAVRMLLGFAPEQPVTPQDLAGPLILNMRQQVTIEGTVVGTIAGEKYFLVDSVLTGAEPSVPTSRELQVYWPGVAKPKVISEPGNYTLNFPCKYGEANSMDVKFSVEDLHPAALREALARQAAEREGVPGAAKAYGEFDAGVAYRYAIRGEPVNVDFTDHIARIVGFRLPAEVATAPAVRAGTLVAAPVGYAFTTDVGVTCLAPADQPTLMARAAGALAGEEVRIRGTTTGLQGGYACVLVDDISFPSQEAPGAARGTSWMVTIQWPGGQPKTLWDYGTYAFVDLPCQTQAGQPVVMQVVLSEFRTLQVELPAAPAAVPPATGAQK